MAPLELLRHRAVVREPLPLEDRARSLEEAVAVADVRPADVERLLNRGADPLTARSAADRITFFADPSGTSRGVIQGGEARDAPLVELANRAACRLLQTYGSLSTLWN